MHGLNDTKLGLTPIPKLGSRADRVLPNGDLDRVAVAAHGGHLYRVHGCPFVKWVHDNGENGPSVALDAIAAETTRLVAGAGGIWAFSPTNMVRLDPETLNEDRRFPAEALAPGASIRDVAISGDDIVALVNTDRGQFLVTTDIKGCHSSPQPLPCGANGADELALTSHSVALLDRSDGRLVFLDRKTLAEQRRILLPTLVECWQASRICGDGASRIAAIGKTPNGTALVLFDATGEPVQTFAAPILADQNADARDLVFTETGLLIATNRGAYRLGTHSGDLGTPASEGRMLTPSLYSPVTAEGRGWLRAEIEADVPKGATISVQVVSTDDDRLASDIEKRFKALPQSAAQRIDGILRSLNRKSDPARDFTITGTTQAKDALSIPLLPNKDRYLWLSLTLRSGSGNDFPQVHGMRVIYPDGGLMNRLPSIFRDKDQDVASPLRTLVGVSETTTDWLDKQIATSSRALDPYSAPVSMLDSLAAWSQLPWHKAMPEGAKRRVLCSGGALLDERGTRAGLTRLLAALLPDATFSILDTVADTGAPILGLDGMARLPLILAGAPCKTPSLSVKARLGELRLTSPNDGTDHLTALAPRLFIDIAASEADRRIFEPLLPEILAQYLPAKLTPILRWGAAGNHDRLTAEGQPLDGAHLAVLNRSALIDRDRLGGSSHHRLPPTGATGFSLT